VGDFDFVGHVLPQAGLEVRFDSVAVKPGRPTTFAVARSLSPQAGTSPHVVFGLPGNPVSVYLGFHLFVLRAAARLTRSAPPLREVSLPLGCDFNRRAAKRAEYVPCRLAEDGRLRPVEFHGSAHLTALSAADGFFIAPAGVRSLSAGQTVRFAGTRFA
jgi:molybdopterin molybdotransferase